MSEINLRSIIIMLAESLGIESSEKLMLDAVKEAKLTQKAFYSEEEFNAICKKLQNRGGFIKTFATLAQTCEYREAQYQKIIDKEDRTRSDLTQMNIEMEMLNNELRVTNDKLKIANDKMKKMQLDLMKSEKLAAIGVLASGVGHELRNPLGSIKNICYYLQRCIKPEDNKIAGFIELLYKEVDTANKIVTDLLDYSRTKKINKQRYDIDALIEDSLSSCPKNQKITVVKNFHPEIKKIDVDPDKMKQVFLNLILNAFQAIPASGSLTITVENADASPSDAPEKLYTAVVFTDTGGGMAQKTLARVFEPLFTTKLKGIGLGLSIAKEIVELHGGMIIASSEPEVGSTFRVLLPRERNTNG